MKPIYLCLLPAIIVLAISCKKNDGRDPGFATNPVLITTAVSSITDTSAVSGGSITTDGSLTITTQGIQWDTVDNFPNNWKQSAATGTNSFLATMSKLVRNHKYYVRAYAGTATGMYYGNTLSFTTTHVLGDYLVTTLAGTGAMGNNNGAAAVATFWNPMGVAVDLSGNVFVAESYNWTIRKISPSGMVSSFAALSFSASDVITDPAGNVYVGMVSPYVLKITAAGVVSTLAGSGNYASQDGTGSAASFYEPGTIAIDRLGNLYVSDLADFRKITPDGVVTTLPNAFAGTAVLNCVAVAVDAEGNVYESNGRRVVKVDTTGQFTPLAGSDNEGFADGQGTKAAFGGLDAMRIDAAGNIYCVDGGNNRIRMVTPDGMVTTIAGSGVAGDKDGYSGIASFNEPFGIALDSLGNIFIGDYGNNKVRKISPL